MADPDGAAVSKAIEKIAQAVSNGVDIEDVALIVRESMLVAEGMSDVSGADKAAFAEQFAVELLDQFLGEGTPALNKLVEEIDIPFLPEAVERVTIDPVLKAWGPTLLKRVIRLALPSLFTLVVDASRGKLGINSGGDA